MNNLRLFFNHDVIRQSCPFFYWLYSNNIERFVRFCFVLTCFFCGAYHLKSQVNTDMVMEMGKGALYYDDYVLSIGYFNQVIDAKPYLSEPYYYRGLAKFYLEDFEGTIEDCSQSIERNPFIMPVYQLRALCYIKRQDFAKAAADYDYILQNDPVTGERDVSLWYNRVLCRIELKDTERAWLELDTILMKWPRYAKAFDLKAQVCLEKKDTLEAVNWLKRSVDVQPQNSEAWAFMASTYYNAEQYQFADSCLTQAITYSPKNVGYYLNRAVARYQLGKLGAVLSDYDEVLNLDPDNFLAHYNRGLLRAQVGDNNRAIVDFNFVLNLEPDNMLARLNRAQLRQKTGDFRGAVADYTAIIKSYPDFLYGYYQRSVCYRRLGMNKAAASDENKIYINQLDRFVSASSRRRRTKAVRKRSNHELESYQQLVVADETDSLTHSLYTRMSRGLVQNNVVEKESQPMLGLIFVQTKGRLNTEESIPTYFLTEIEQINQKKITPFRIEMSTAVKRTVGDFGGRESLEELRKSLVQMQTFESWLLSAICDLYLAHYTNGLGAVNEALVLNSHSVMAMLVYSELWVKYATVHPTQNERDSWALLLKQLNAFLQKNGSSENQVWPIIYNRACVETHLGMNKEALNDYNRVLSCQPRFAEAWYNRGLLHLQMNEKKQGLSDLRKAGELGLYAAYSILKQESAQ